MGWYRVVKTIKGHRYLYLQRTWREGKHVRTESRYIGPADTIDSGVATTDVSGELEPLAAEARKYKSAEEFVKAQINAYHGTDATFNEFDITKKGQHGSLEGEGIYLTSSPEIASRYAGASGRVMDVHIDKNS